MAIGFFCVFLSPSKVVRRTFTGGSPDILKWNSKPLVKEMNAIEEAKNWIRDCRWREDEQDDDWIDDLDDLAIIRGIDRHYAGGWSQFLENLTDPEKGEMVTIH